MAPLSSLLSESLLSVSLSRSLSLLLNNSLLASKSLSSLFIYYGCLFFSTFFCALFIFTSMFLHHHTTHIPLTLTTLYYISLLSPTRFIPVSLITVLQSSFSCPYRPIPVLIPRSLDYSTSFPFPFHSPCPHQPIPPFHKLSHSSLPLGLITPSDSVGGSGGGVWWDTWLGIYP